MLSRSKSEPVVEHIALRGTIVQNIGVLFGQLIMLEKPKLFRLLVLQIVSAISTHAMILKNIRLVTLGSSYLSEQNEKGTYFTDVSFKI